MVKIFDENDRKHALDFIFSAAEKCEKTVALVQVGSGAAGFHDNRSDLDFVIALDTDASMQEVMEYMHRMIAGQYEVLYFRQDLSHRLQCYLLSDLLEIDIGYGAYERAAAWKPAFKVLFDRSGTVEEKMTRSLEWMENNIFSEKQKKDNETARDNAWAHLMHAAVAIRRGNPLRALGEMEYVRKLYIDLVCGRSRLESTLSREADRLPEPEKAAILSTLPAGTDADALRTALYRLTDLLCAELKDGMPVTREMLYAYYEGM